MEKERQGRGGGLYKPIGYVDRGTPASIRFVEYKITPENASATIWSNVEAGSTSKVCIESWCLLTLY